ncbi:MAG: glycosyl hydrolase, partial [Sphingopyxis sp.]
MARHLRGLTRATIAAALMLGGTMLTAPAHADELADGFQNPPQSARPRVWWHWMNGNVTVAGIDADLEWLHRVGVGGVQNFDANLQTPQIVNERLIYMTPPWRAAFRHAVERADALGMEFAIAASPGWSETGGAWVPPADGMKKLVWSETLIPGGRRYTGRIAPAPDVTGPYQSVRLYDPLAPDDAANAAPPRAQGDIAVLAIPVAPADVALPTPAISTADGAALPAAALFDADMESSVAIARGTADAPGTMTYTYPRDVTVRSARLFVPRARPPFGDAQHTPVLEVERNGAWQRVTELPLTDVATTASFAPVTGRRFRLVMAPFSGQRRASLGQPAPGAEMVAIFGTGAGETIGIGDFQLSGEGRIDHAEVKAGFGMAHDYGALAPAQDGAGVAQSRIVDVTSMLRADGTLDWTPPAGSQWRILRMGYSLTGKTNHPATPEATGLEVDKYDPAAVRRYLETYLGMYRETVGDALMGQRGIQALLTDSIEVGPSNWTPRMLEEFRTRRGYDARMWLPALAGIIINSRADSERFLHDYRQTLAEFLAQSHYATVAAVAHEQGLRVYGEALEDGRPVLGDDMAMRAHTDVPMAALWTYARSESPRPTLLGDMRGAASVAHIYGQNIVAAESMTSAFAPWAFAPSDLKRIIDLEFANGVNRPIIHTSVHQPVDDKVPGL